MQVLLDGTAGIVLTASATDVDSLVLLEMDVSPDFVLLYANQNHLAASAEVKQIAKLWPKTDCVVLVEEPKHFQLMKEAGASFVLLKGATPQRLREIIESLADLKLQSEMRT